MGLAGSRPSKSGVRVQEKLVVYHQPVANQLARSAIITDDPHALLPFLAGCSTSDPLEFRGGHQLACSVITPALCLWTNCGLNWCLAEKTITLLQAAMSGAHLGS